MAYKKGTRNGKFGPGEGGHGKTKGAKSLIRKITAEAVLGCVDEVLIWKSLIECDDKRIVLEAMKYLTDRRDGKAVQAVDVNAAAVVVLSLGNLPETKFENS